jgi:hypothetical protein
MTWPLAREIRTSRERFAEVLGPRCRRAVSSNVSAKSQQ